MWYAPREHPSGLHDNRGVAAPLKMLLRGESDEAEPRQRDHAHVNGKSVSVGRRGTWRDFKHLRQTHEACKHQIKMEFILEIWCLNVLVAAYISQNPPSTSSQQHFSEPTFRSR